MNIRTIQKRQPQKTNTVRDEIELVLLSIITGCVLAWTLIEKI